MRDTLSFSESVKGWTSFFSFIPDFITRINNRTFSVKNGELFMHDDETNSQVCKFYGANSENSKVKTIFNDGISEDKIFKTLVLEGTKPWATELQTNYTRSTIASSEFNARESRWFAHTRNNEDESVVALENTQGIGVILSFTGLTVRFTRISESVKIGESLCQLDNADQEVIGIITQINRTTNTITVSSFITTPTPGLFAFSKKDARTEGGKMRGYYMEVDLTDFTNTDSELFAVTTNAVKSYV